jgi:hypothetical protein
LKKMVSMTALSGVGVAAGAGVAVCATVFELNIEADAATTSAVNKALPSPIAVSFSKAGSEGS